MWEIYGALKGKEASVVKESNARQCEGPENVVVILIIYFKTKTQKRYFEMRHQVDISLYIIP